MQGRSKRQAGRENTPPKVNQNNFFQYSAVISRAVASVRKEGQMPHLKLIKVIFFSTVQ